VEAWEFGQFRGRRARAVTSHQGRETDRC